MKVEILYVTDCPTHLAVVALVNDVLAEHGVSAEIEEILVSDEVLAKKLQFRGSPTVRIDGRDVIAGPDSPGGTAEI